MLQRKYIESSERLRSMHKNVCFSFEYAPVKSTFAYMHPAYKQNGFNATKLYLCMNN